MKEQITQFDEIYTLMANGLITLNSHAMFNLGWKSGKTKCAEYIDVDGGRLIVVNGEEALTMQLPIMGWSFPISVRNAITIPSQARSQLGWLLGTKLKQTLDEKMKAIIVTKAIEEDPLANTAKLSELNETEKES